MTFFAAAHMDAIDALGLQQFDLYGGHTGGNLACEIAIAHPNRVGAMILDGMSLYTDEERAEMLEHYAPPLHITDDGRHLIWLWSFIRDAYLFWPWYKRDAAHVRGVGLPSPDALHDKFVEVVKAARTYRVSYNAAFTYPKAARLPLVRTPTLLACAETDMLLPYLEQVARLMPHARKLITKTRPAEAARASEAEMVAFLDSAARAERTAR
jgi:pimeloyl-ACP methyl ester carboxylesterase